MCAGFDGSEGLEGFQVGGRVVVMAEEEGVCSGLVWNRCLCIDEFLGWKWQIVLHGCLRYLPRGLDGQGVRLSFMHGPDISPTHGQRAVQPCSASTLHRSCQAKPLWSSHGQTCCCLTAGDLREALYKEVNTFVEALGSRDFMGGSSPNLADLAMFGVLRAVAGTPTYNDIVINSKAGLKSNAAA